MSGHSKWATIKHQKGAKDKARGKLFAKLIRQVEVAAREGGGDPDELMLLALEAGAEDMEDQGDMWQVTTAPTDLAKVRAALEEAGVTIESADLTMLPTTTVALGSEADARRVLKVIDALEDQDDVQAVYANFDIPDSVLQAVEA